MVLTKRQMDYLERAGLREGLEIEREEKQSLLARVAVLEHEVMSAHALIAMACACEICAKFAAARDSAYETMMRAEVQL